MADFYCPSEKLIIELDGQRHYTSEGITKDTERDNHLEEMNIRVLRFENREVLNNLTSVLKRIKNLLKPPALIKYVHSYSPFLRGWG